MSTLVVVRKSRQVCIAADSQTTHGDLKQSSDYEIDHNKVFTYKNNLIGTVGSASNDMALFAALKKKKDCDFSNRQSIFESFCQLHKILKDDYHLNPDEQAEDPYESTRMEVLIANPYGIFGVYALREVFEYSRFWAAGSGRDFALGAMLGAYEKHDNPESIARLGAQAGVEFDASSCAPIKVQECRLK